MIANTRLRRHRVQRRAKTLTALAVAVSFVLTSLTPPLAARPYGDNALAPNSRFEQNDMGRNNKTHEFLEVLTDMTRNTGSKHWVSRLNSDSRRIVEDLLAEKLITLFQLDFLLPPVQATPRNEDVTLAIIKTLLQKKRLTPSEIPKLEASLRPIGQLPSTQAAGYVLTILEAMLYKDLIGVEDLPSFAMLLARKGMESGEILDLIMTILERKLISPKEIPLLDKFVEAVLALGSPHPALVLRLVDRLAEAGQLQRDDLFKIENLKETIESIIRAVGREDAPPAFNLVATLIRQEKISRQEIPDWVEPLRAIRQYAGAGSSGDAYLQLNSMLEEKLIEKDDIHRLVRISEMARSKTPVALQVLRQLLEEGDIKRENFSLSGGRALAEILSKAVLSYPEPAEGIGSQKILDAKKMARWLSQMM